MGRLFVIVLEGNIYRCRHCNTHLALADDIISRIRGVFDPSPPSVRLGFGSIKNIRPLSFHSRHGKAYLFLNVVNITIGEKEERLMMTGMHTVVDIFCVSCGASVGWRYEAAHDKTQMYKEGKFILERYNVYGSNGNEYAISPEAQLGSDTDEG